MGPFDMRASRGLSGSHGIEKRYFYAVENVARTCKKLGKSAVTRKTSSPTGTWWPE